MLTGGAGVSVREREGNGPRGRCRAVVGLAGSGWFGFLFFETFFFFYFQETFITFEKYKFKLVQTNLNNFVKIKIIILNTLELSP